MSSYITAPSRVRVLSVEASTMCPDTEGAVDAEIEIDGKTLGGVTLFVTSLRRRSITALNSARVAHRSKSGRRARWPTSSEARTIAPRSSMRSTSRFKKLLLT